MDLIQNLADATRERPSEKGLTSLFVLARLQIFTGPIPVTLHGLHPARVIKGGS